MRTGFDNVIVMKHEKLWWSLFIFQVPDLIIWHKKGNCFRSLDYMADLNTMTCLLHEHWVVAWVCNVCCWVVASLCNACCGKHWTFSALLLANHQQNYNFYDRSRLVGKSVGNARFFSDHLGRSEILVGNARFSSSVSLYIQRV